MLTATESVPVRFALGAMLATWMLVAPQTAQAAERTVPGDPFAAKVSDRILAALVEANGVPGMAGAVWSEGQLVWSGSAGYRNLEDRLPVTGDTKFRLASVSKVFAAVAAAKLKEQGRLNVDAPVRSIVRYLPDRWPLITTAQLAAHTSGIPHYQEIDEGRGGRRFASMREAIGVFQDRDLLFRPGAAYGYSSWGFALLAAVVEESAGQSYLDYLARDITTGLKIGIDATDSADADASRAYEFGEGGVVTRAAPHDYSYSLGGAGMGATAPDLARFGGRLISGEVVSRRTFDWMLVPARLADGSPAMNADATVGFGLRTNLDIDGDRIVHHAGVTNGARSALVMYPERGMAVGILSNALWVSSIEQTAVMLAAPFRPAAAGATSVPCPTAAVAYDGEYDGKPITGTARFTMEEGVCTGVVGVDNQFGRWLNGFPQKDASIVKVIGIDRTGGLARAALVTPVAVYDLRRKNGGPDHVAAINSTRTLSMTFRTRPPSG